VLRRLDQLDALMSSDELDPKQWDMLSRAYDRVFKAWMVLSATPGPGQRKPATIRTRGQPAGPGSFHEPESAPYVQPAAAPTCGPDTPTGSVPVNNSNVQTPQDGK
jgi:hypothetical protein